MGIHHFETSTTASWKRSLDRKRPLGYHSNSYSWNGKERTPPFGQTALVCTGKQTNLGFSEGILPRQLEFSFFDGEVNVIFEWSTLFALGRRTTVSSSQLRTVELRNVPSARETRSTLAENKRFPDRFLINIIVALTLVYGWARTRRRARSRPSLSYGLCRARSGRALSLMRPKWQKNFQPD